MGEVRLKIEPAQISMAIKCDKDAKIVSQGSAPIELKTGDQSRMVLLEDLKVDKERCGFKFNKGAEFSYILSANGLLLVNFANASNGMFKRLSN